MQSERRAYFALGGQRNKISRHKNFVKAIPPLEFSQFIIAALAIVVLAIG